LGCRAWRTSIAKAAIRYSLFASSSMAYIHRKRPYSPFAIRHSLPQGGAGRSGSRPLASDLFARGTKNALLGRLRRPPGAWIGLSTMPEAGYRRLDFAAPGLLPRPCAEGAPASASNPVRRLSRVRWRLDGLSTMPADAPGCGTPAPGPDPTAAAAPPDLPRHVQHATYGTPSSSSVYIHDESGLAIPVARSGPIILCPSQTRRLSQGEAADPTRPRLRTRMLGQRSP
jgi:hypothetical protein